MNKSIRRFITLFAIITGGLLITAGVFNFCIDPFYQYHKPWFGIEPYMDEAVYQTPGAARNFDYDSVILGSSMTENFSAAYFDENLGWNTIKLSYSGAGSDDYEAILEQIERSGNEVKNFLIDIDMYTFTALSGDIYTSRPKYLYDTNYINDICYLWNLDVCKESAEALYDCLQDNQKDPDTSYYWHNVQYDTNALLGRYKWEREHSGYQNTAPEEYIARCEQNLSPFVKYVEAHPDTMFYFYFPPYSVLYWDMFAVRGDLDAQLNAQGAIMQMLLSYPNVKVYYYLDCEEITTNFDNYVDMCHHNPDINTVLAQKIVKGENEITAENYEQKLDEMRKFATEYDFEGLLYPGWQGE